MSKNKEAIITVNWKLLIPIIIAALILFSIIAFTILKYKTT